MIANFFNKTNPINYIILLLLLLVLTFLYGFSHATLAWYQVLGQQFLVFVLLSVCLILLEQLCQKKELTRNNSFAFLLAILYLFFIPKIFLNVKLIASVLMILLSFRILILMQERTDLKSKIFDASILILTASIFEFWAILYLILLYINLLYIRAFNYRNFIIPFFAIASYQIIFFSICTFFDLNYLKILNEHTKFSFELNMNYQNYEALSFSILFALILIGIIFFFKTLSKKAILKKQYYYKLLWSSFIGFLVFLISFQKKPEHLIWLIFPAAILSANYLEKIEDKRFQNFLLWVITLASFGLYYMQL
jgi:hypothetical protein